MDFLHRLALRTQMVLLATAIVATLLALGLYNAASTARVAEGGRDIFQVHLHAVQYALEAKATFQSLATALNQHINSTTPAEFDRVEQVVKQAKSELDQAIATYEQAAQTPKERDLLVAIKAGVADYERPMDRLMEFDRAGKPKEAKVVATQMREARQIVTGALNELVKLNVAGAEAQDRANNALASLTRRNSLVAVLLVSLIYFGLALAAPALIARPLGEVQSVMDAVGNGDLTREVAFEGGNELGRLGAAANRTIAGLRALVSQVVLSADRVAASSSQLAHAAGQAGEVGQQVATTIEELATGADEQARAAQAVSRVMQDMSISTQHVASATQRMVADATEAVRTAGEGREAVNRSIAQITSIKRTVDQSAAAVKGLGERSQQIGKIVEMITGIADQTNLLALNAAIEAARAGEQGRGFAVVAEEVRKLAEQSRAAAEQIAGLIREIQAETAKAVAAMEAGTREVASGTEVVAGTGHAFESIVGAVQTVMAQIEEVSTATQSLASGSAQVVRSVESIAAVTEQSAAGAEEVSASAQEQTASLQQIGAGAATLADLAQQLKKAASSFVLPS
ncbi:MAG: methyl-accepting chemotaxis protein [Chitinophagales bacterium]